MPAHASPSTSGLHKNPRFPSAEKQVQRGLTVQERSQGPLQLSQSSRIHSSQLAASPPALCCCQLWPSLDCFHISKGPSQAALCCSGWFLAKTCSKRAQVSGVPGLLALLNDTIHTVMEMTQSGTLTNSVWTTASPTALTPCPRLHTFCFQFLL